MQNLIRIWQRLTDPVMYRKRFRRGLRCFKKNAAVKSKSLEDLGPLRKVVVVVAHPDDETFCSGLICELVERGVVVDVLCLTRGEGGPTGDWTREELGAAREAEMRKACGVLGVRELVFLDHIDPVAKRHKVFAPAVSVAGLAEQIAPHLEEADLVITHGSSGEYWHPAHLLVHKAVKQQRGERLWASFLAARRGHPIPRLVNLDDPAHLVLDLSGYAARREESLSCHVSQAKLFGKFANGTLADFIRKTSIESYCLRDPENG